MEPTFGEKWKAVARKLMASVPDEPRKPTFEEAWRNYYTNRANCIRHGKLNTAKRTFPVLTEAEFRQKFGYLED